jgi:hypothetical protein
MNAFFHGIEKAVEDTFHGAEQIWENVWNYQIRFDGRKPEVSAKASSSFLLLISNTFLSCRKPPQFIGVGNCFSPIRILPQLKYPR